MLASPEDGDILQARDLVWQYQFHATDPPMAKTTAAGVAYAPGSIR